MCIGFEAIICRYLWIVVIGSGIPPVVAKRRRCEDKRKSYPNISAVIHRYWQVIHR
jgi:hypothetical protein